MNKILICILYITMILTACQKETSVEGNGSVQVATGSLQDSAGNCQSIIINGLYRKDVTLDASNNIGVKVNFTQAGSFTFFSDTVNGVWFRLQSFAFVAGSQIVSVRGYGKIVNDVDFNLTLRFGNSICGFSIKKFTPVLINGTSNDYFPTTNFSRWTYDNNILNDTTVVSVTGLDKVILGNRYRKFLLQNRQFFITDTLLYRKDGAGNYYKYDTIATGPKIEYQILKDYNAVNDTFSSPVVVGNYLGNPTDVKYFFTMLRKNVRRTINGNNVDSIIIVKQETQYLIGGTFTTTNTFEFSYAKKIGLVNVQQTGAPNNLLSPVKSWVVN
jgi:hypothetical protein